MTDSSTTISPPMVGVYVFLYSLLEGVQRVSGVFFLSALELLGLNRVQASFPFLLGRAVSNLIGVAVRGRADIPLRQNPRTWVVKGAVVAAVGVGLCCFTEKAAWLTVFWGGLFGAGIGIVVPILTGELAKDNSRTDVSPLLPVSLSIGCIVLPFIITASISKYGLSGSFLVIAGVILNSVLLIFIANCKWNCQLQIRLPKSRWRLRKKSKQYQMTHKEKENDNVAFYKPTALQEFYDESFLENMEPDVLQKVSGSNHDSATKFDFVDILQPIIDAKRKMTSSGASEKKSSESGHKNSSGKLDNNLGRKLSEIVTDIEKYENNRKPFEESFSQMNIISEEASSPNESINSDDRNESITGSSNSKSVESSQKSKHGCVENSENITDDTKDTSIVFSTSNTTVHVQKSLPSNQSWNGKPLEIKVHVVECTITTNADFFDKQYNQNIQSGKKAYRRHSNSLISDSYDNIDFTKLLLNNKASSFQRTQLNTASKMFLITEEDEIDFEKQQAIFRKSHDVEALKPLDKEHSKTIRNLLFRILNPQNAAVVYAFATYEITLDILLTMFADFASDLDDDTVDSNFVLVAFGIGGIIGQTTFVHFSRRLMEDGSHAAAAIFFMLLGLVVAGILWSGNMCWLCGFYAGLGFVESGVQVVLPKLTADFSDEKNVTMLTATYKCASAICTLCLPFAIGLSRDAAGDYDGVLQVTSCVCVSGALLCYFLPKFAAKNAKR